MKSKKTLPPNPLNSVKNERGIAIIMAVAALAFIVYLAMQVMYDTHVEYVVNSQELNRIRAYYAARSAVDIGLLRIKIYHNLQASLGDKLGPYAAYVNEIWQFPFMWPPPTPDNLSGIDKDMMKKTIGESFMDASYTLSIHDEASKIDINDLNSPSKNAQKLVKNQLLAIFENKKDSDDEFRRRYDGFRFDELIGQITDWMSDKRDSVNGGDKKNAFNKVLDGEGDLPPNRAFRSLGELKLIPLMNDELFSLLENRITLYGLRGVNPNTASREVLRSLDSGITEEVAGEIENRRSKTPFESKQDFVDFINLKAKDLTVKADSLPISFDTLTSFVIKGIGSYGDATKEIQVVTMDISNSARKIKSLVDEESKQEKQGTPTGPTNPAPATPGAPSSGGNTSSETTKPKLTPLKGSPRVVEWTER